MFCASAPAARDRLLGRPKGYIPPAAETFGMAVGRKETVKGARGLLGTLLVAWTFVTGSALLLASAYYQRTGDIRVLIVWLAPPFLIGLVIFGTIGLVSLFGSVRTTEVEVVHAKGTRHSIFRR